jgi:hypothetical protein
MFLKEQTAEHMLHWYKHEHDWGVQVEITAKTVACHKEKYK